MKIYISLPITGHDIEEVEASCIYASGVIQAKGHTPVSPLDISPDPDATYSEHMGNDIEALLNCDAVLFMEFYSLDRIPNTDIKPPESCPYHVKDFKECKDRSETIRPDGNRKINCTCDYFTKNMLIEFGNFKIK